MVSIWINLFEESLNWFKIESFDSKLFCNFAEIVINIPKNDSDIQRKLRLSGCFIVCYLATWRHINFFLTCNEHSFSIRPSSNSIFAATPRILSSIELFLVKEKRNAEKVILCRFQFNTKETIFGNMCYVPTDNHVLTKFIAIVLWGFWCFASIYPYITITNMSIE